MNSINMLSKLTMLHPGPAKDEQDFPNNLFFLLLILNSITKNKEILSSCAFTTLCRYPDSLEEEKK